MNSYNYTILLASNEPITQILIKDVIEQASLDHVFVNVFIVKSPVEAVDYLESKVSSVDNLDSCLPLVILSDFNISVLSSLELLTWVKQHPLLNQIPVVVISDLEDKNQAIEAMHLGASSYFVKSEPIENLIYLIKALLPWLLLDYGGN
ncbi:response regulator [Nostoc sp. FACHB-888]|uniref:response regulator n=1 Tax=Nostoc sp. FACHB-888 TaxID=2692842 RepID=UPI001689E51A|nr:response regulator [Nostoc sp. FACHB-888]MBD2247762.1 response regulator [Nostoc sp. FACHB-888]